MFRIPKRKAKPKYGNLSCTVRGKTFQSKKEANRYLILEGQEKRGLISDLQCQVRYELQAEFMLNGKKYRPIAYIADFVYNKDGKVIVEDVKGMRTQLYLVKKKLLAYVHQIEITEI